MLVADSMPRPWDNSFDYGFTPVVLSCVLTQSPPAMPPPCLRYMASVASLCWARYALNSAGGMDWALDMRAPRLLWSADVDVVEVCCVGGEEDACWWFPFGLTKVAPDIVDAVSGWV